jgi:TonB family protein
MKKAFLTLGLTWALSSLAQTNQPAVVPSACRASQLVKGGVPTKSFERAAGESYKHAPIVSFTIKEDGSIANVRLVRSSGIRDLDRQVLKAVARWKYKPNPGCTIETKMSLTIDWN